MKKIMISLFSVMLTMNCVTLAANAYIYSENEQQTLSNARITGDLCNFKFILREDDGLGWYPNQGIKITVDGIDYGFLNLAWETAYAEEIVGLPSGEVKLFWQGGFDNGYYHFEVYNSLDELIYTCPENLDPGLFFTYQNECSCLPITNFVGEYIQKEKQVNLRWNAPETPALQGFDIYRNDSMIAQIASTVISYTDSTANLESGVYKYCVIPVYLVVCNLENECFETSINVGIKDYETQIMVYPNPAKDELRIENGELRIENIEIYDVYGRKTFNFQLLTFNSIDVSSLTNGIYFVKIVTERGIITKKIVIMK